jgi:hypothetical protein
VKRFLPGQRAGMVIGLGIFLFASHITLDGQAALFYPFSDLYVGYSYDRQEWVWDERIHMIRDQFPLSYKILQISGILLTAALLYAFWPSRAISREPHSRALRE